MAKKSAGKIQLDLEVNQRIFKQQMVGIQGLAKKAGLALAAAFSIKKLVDFSAQCLELGSDLAEVQNVVDVTFPRMSKQIDSFAKNAAVQFGLSETMAKKFTGTFGAMAKAFGFGEQQAYEMATALTGLAGDVASFYNISQDEAYTKLKSVFTGETETLKDLGIVMTQSALDTYAMANGFGRVTAQMSEAEKVALRYQFVQEQLSLAAGDFVRTSDGWANQVRILKLQFDSLKATIGQGLINVLTPVIKVINTIIGKLMSLANAFKSFTDMLTGKKSGAGVSGAANSMNMVAKSADEAKEAAGGVGGASQQAANKAGSAAKKAAKEIRGITTAIDELNIIDTDTDLDTETGSGGGGAGGGYAADDFDMGELDASGLEETTSRYQALIDRVKELAGLVKRGFWDGLGDIAVFDSIQESIQGIKRKVIEIFTAPEVLDASRSFADKTAYNLGVIAGSVVSIGASIADNLLGGIYQYLEQSGSRIRGYLVEMFKISGKAADIAGDFARMLATVTTSIRGEGAKQITGAITGFFSEAFMGVSKLAARALVDVADVLVAPFAETADQIRIALENTFDAVAPLFQSLEQLTEETFDKIGIAYDSYIVPMLEAFKQGFTEIISVFLNLYNAYIVPVLKGISDQFIAFKEESLNPLIDKFLEFCGKVAEALTDLWVNILQPVILYLLEEAAPVVGGLLQTGVELFFSFLESVSEVLGYIIEALGGLIDFLVGVFSGNWKMAWEGIRVLLYNVWEAVKALVSGALNVIKLLIQTAWDFIKNITASIWTGIHILLDSIWSGLKNLADTLFQAIWNLISSIWEKLRSSTARIWEGIRTLLSNLWESVRTNAVNQFTAIKTAILTIWNTLKTETKKIWDGIWSTIKGVINFIIGGVEGMVNRVIDGINNMINAVNSVAGRVPGVPTIPNIPGVSLPRLAQGGFVRANSPQLAMIGDNRHYGEIVAPEDKMQEMADRAAALANRSSGISDQYLPVVVELLRHIIELIEAMDLTVTIDIREIRKKLAELDKRSGYSLSTT